eukprot:SAG22_NODE_9376_length_592_cov_1.653144_2_plen_35_part_01
MRVTRDQLELEEEEEHHAEGAEEEEAEQVRLFEEK